MEREGKRESKMESSPACGAESEGREFYGAEGVDIQEEEQPQETSPAKSFSSSSPPVSLNSWLASKDELAGE